MSSRDREPYNWRRYWVARGEAYPADESGYPWNPEDDPLKLEIGGLNTLEDLDRDYPCLVLLGEAGLGKSYAMRTMQSPSPGATLSLNLAEFSGEERLYRKLFDAAVFQEWRGGDQVLTVLLDSFDECQLHLETLAGFLRSELDELDRSRLRLRIACRTHAWPQSLDQAFQDWWGAGYGAFELVPLHQGHVREAAERKKVSASAFLRGVASLDLEALAARPVTLEFLLEEFASSGSLPDRPESVYEQGMVLLAARDAEVRRESGTEGELGPHARLALARRLAAFTIFSGRPAFTQLPSADEACLTTCDPVLISETEPDHGDQIKITIRRLDEVLRTGLFTGGEGGRMIWSHRSFAEFLAAQYLEIREFKDEQVADLLFHRDEHTGSDGIIPAQLRDTAIWVALHRPFLVDRILRTSPEVLVSSTLAEHPPEIRARVVQGLLEGVSSRRIHSWDRRLRADYRWMTHPKLAEQLRPWITNPSIDWVARRVAVEVAQACNCSSLAPTLAELALDGSQPQALRSAMAWAVANLSDLDARRALRPLLAGDPADVDDEVLGAALDALWPGGMTASELFGSIRAPRDATYGFYEVFLSRLSDRLSPEHLPEALRWVQSQAPDFRYPHSLRRLLKGILSRAWEALEDSKVLEVFIEVAMHRMESGYSILETDDRQALNHVQRCRRLLGALVPSIAAENSKLWSYLHDYVRSEEFDWLVDRALETQNSEERSVWQLLASMAFRSGMVPKPEHAARVLELQERLPALRDRVSYWLDAVDLDSSEAEEQRAIHRQSIARGHSTMAAESVETQAVSRLDDFDSGNTANWWILNLELAKNARGFGGEFELDLTALDSWQLLSPEVQERCLAAGRRYLEVADPSTETWLGTNVFHRPATAGAKALALLHRLQPEALSSLSEAEWERWTPSLLGFPGNSGTQGERAREELARLAWMKAPEVFKRTLLALIDVEKNQREGFLGVLYPLAPALEIHRDLQDVLVQKAELDLDLKPQSLQDLLEPPLRQFHSDALDLAYRITRGDVERPRPVRVMAASLLLRYHPSAAWGVLWPLLSSESSLAREVLVRYGGRLDARDDIPLLRELDEGQLADLYDVLCRLYPPSEYSQLVSGVVHPENRIAEIRDSIPGQLVTRGTLTAVTALSQMLERFPDQEWLAYRVAAAEAARVARAYEPVSPGALLEMARSSMRVVRSGADLLELVLGALHNYRAELRQERFRRESLWNELRPKPESQLRDLIWDVLKTRLAALGVVADREVLVDRFSETDVHVTAVRLGEKAGFFHQERVIIEIKGDWHKDVKKAMKTQLLDRYLREANCAFGVYVVGWFGQYGEEGEKRQGVRGMGLEEVTSLLEEQATELTGARQLRAVVLDASRTPVAPRSRKRKAAASRKK